MGEGITPNVDGAHIVQPPSAKKIAARQLIR
jgi:hypothetical protein